ncbi:MAG TPA: cupin domain-containing protein [Spongiibacteraceae bacterium]|nr:cupin domain-containing protein [Spongiibacteraceae bacterium]
MSRPIIAPIVWPNLIDIDPDNADLMWETLQPGVRICMLHGDRTSGCSTALLRYEPGASVPPHTHTGHEHLLILRGSQRDENGVYSAGTFLINKPAGGHRVSSDDGCLVLAIWEAPVRFD